MLGEDVGTVQDLAECKKEFFNKADQFRDVLKYSQRAFDDIKPRKMAKATKATKEEAQEKLKLSKEATAARTAAVKAQSKAEEKAVKDAKAAKKTDGDDLASSSANKPWDILENNLEHHIEVLSVPDSDFDITKVDTDFPYIVSG